MHKLMTYLGAALALPTIASAQLLVAPDTMQITNTGSSGLTWRSTAFRFQMIYDTTHFTNQGVVGPVSIDRMRFRALGGTVNPGGQQYLGDGATFGVNISIGDSATDYLAPSTTFALNRGTMQSVMQFGTVTVLPATGGVPNDYVIDIPIPGGFVYDPTLGADLLIEVDAPAPTLSMPSMATSNLQATHRAVRISQNSQAATTGSLSGFASVVLFDISGGPGGTPVIVAASAQSYGGGCYNVTRAYAEQFDAPVGTNFDLGGGLTMVPDVAGAPSSYVVVPGASGYYTPTGSPVTTAALGVMGDDSMSGALNLPFSFPYVGGSTNVIHVTSNGYIQLGATTLTTGDFSPTLAEVGSGPARLMPYWHDLHASRNVTLNPAAGIYFDVDAVANEAYVTFVDVGEFATSTAGGASYNFQVKMAADGTVEYRYQAMSPAGSTTSPVICGFAPGLSQAPFSVDISASMPFTTGAIDQLGLVLTGTAPLLGGSTTLTTSAILAGGLTINILSVGQINPGLDLGIVGAPGCNAYVTLPEFFSSLLFLSPSDAVTVAIPNDAALAGASVYSQSVTLAAGVNALNAITSNGVALKIGNFQ
jgi:hypothetical protein